MNELFKEDYTKARDTLYNKGYYVANMVYNSNCYEVYDGNGKVLIDLLSLSQLCQLAEML